MAKTQDFSHDFPGSAIDPAIFDVTEDPVVQDHKAVLDSGDGLTVKNKYDLTDSYIFQKVEVEPGIIFIFSLDQDEKNKVGFFKKDDQLNFRAIRANRITEKSIPYDAAAHAWWKLRESKGTVYFDVSPDGKNWTTAHSMNAPFAMSNLSIHYRTQDISTGIGWGFGPWGTTPWGGQPGGSGSIAPPIPLRLSDYTETWSSGEIDPYRWAFAATTDSGGPAIDDGHTIVDGRMRLRYREAAGNSNYSYDSIVSNNFHADGHFYFLTKPGNSVSFQYDGSEADGSRLDFGLVDYSQDYIVHIYVVPYGASPVIQMEWYVIPGGDYGLQVTGAQEVPYNPVAHAYLRVRLDTDMFAVFDGSPDGVVWTELYRTTEPMLFEYGVVTFGSFWRDTADSLNVDDNHYVDNIVFDVEEGA